MVCSAMMSGGTLMAKAGCWWHHVRERPPSGGEDHRADTPLADLFDVATLHLLDGDQQARLVLGECVAEIGQGSPAAVCGLYEFCEL